MMMRSFRVAAAVLAFALGAGAASAQDRAVNTGLGAVAGALVAGPIGAVAGGAIGYGAGHRISRGLGRSGRKSHRQRRAAYRRQHQGRAGR